MSAPILYRVTTYLRHISRESHLGTRQRFPLCNEGCYARQQSHRIHSECTTEEALLNRQSPPSKLAKRKDTQ
jgi:hypothetical protein